jgi:predicted site-specific integrase-resolvase
MDESQQTWVAVKDVCGQYGVKYATARAQINAGSFPVTTFMMGKIHAIDKEVHRQYFLQKRAEGLQALNSTLG